MTVSRLRVAVGVLASSFVLAIVLGATGVVAPRGSVAFGASTSLAILSGEVLVSRSGGAFAPAEDGAILGPGDSVRTGAEARAVLTYFEGSTVTIEPESEMRIDQATTDADGSTILVMTQNLGRTWHVVTRLVNGNSRYDVRTPAATASVRGTAFEVALEQDPATGQQVSTVTTAEGAVATTVPATAQQPTPDPVVVVAGFSSRTKVGDARPEAPKPAPEAERVVKVTIANPSGVVVDNKLGGSAGVTETGKVVSTIPSAVVVRNADGSFTVILRNVPDGKLSTVVTKAATEQTREVEVTTTLEERGKEAVKVVENVVSDAPKVVTGVELKRSEPDKAPDLRQLKDEEKKDLKTEKVVDAPKLEAKPPVFRPGLERPVPAPVPDVRKAEEKKEEQKTDASQPVTPARAPVGLGPVGRATPRPSPTKKADAEPEKAEAPAQSGNASEDKGDASHAPTGGFVPAIGLRQSPQGGTVEEQAKKADEDVKKAEGGKAAAEQFGRAADDAKRRAEDEQRKAEEAKRAADAAKQRAEAESKRLEEAKRAADEAKKKADEDAAKALDAARRRAAELESQRKAEEAKRLEEQKKVADESRRKAEIESKQKADEARRHEESRRAAEAAQQNAAREAQRRAQEMADAQRRGEELRQRIQQQRPRQPARQNQQDSKDPKAHPSPNSR